jgi:hypothetical protein
MSMSDTSNLGLPTILGPEPEYYVTHNEALRLIDTLVQLAVLDRDRGDPPASPAEGERWIVAADPTDDWIGHADHVAAWQDGAWQFATPRLGWVAYVVDEGTLVVWNGAAWGDFFATVTAIQNLALFGLGTAADATNPFSAKLNKVLWTAKTVAEGGDGDLRYTLNKDTAADVLSLLLQSGFSGRAELGLIGDDNVTLKVSADGSNWTTALTVDKASGGIAFRAAEASVASAATCDIGGATQLKVVITGSTTITSLGGVAHACKLARFAGALTLTHNATSLALPGAADIVTAPGDTGLFVSDAAGHWRCHAYHRASGRPLAPALPSSTTDEAIVRFDGNAGNQQDNAYGFVDDFGGFASAPRFSIADDGVASFTVPGNSVALVLIVENAATAPRLQGLFWCRATASPTCSNIALATTSGVTFTTGPLTGTSGIDGNQTLATHTDGKLYIENRSGVTRTYSLMFMSR